MWKCFTDCKAFRCCYVFPQRFSFLTICFNFWKSSNVPFYPLLSVQFSGIKDTHVIVQPASPSIHRMFYIKNKTLSQLYTNTSFSLLSTPGKHQCTPDLYEFASSQDLMWVESYNICPLWRDFFLSFLLPVVKYTQHTIDHLTVCKCTGEWYRIHSSILQPSPPCVSTFFLPETWDSAGPQLPSPTTAPDDHHPAFCLYQFAYSAT